jgi:hypothetical protein
VPGLGHRSSCRTCCRPHGVQRADEFIDLCGGKERIEATWREIGKRGFVESAWFDYALFRQVIDDQVDCGGNG